jgi:L-ascorbate metabolism protein UlaG (beta-lactamase superfamily)
VYIGGDTGWTPEMQALVDVEVALVPMNLPYTMSPGEAAACVKAFKPRIVYPYHFFGSDPKAFAAALEGTGIKVRATMTAQARMRNAQRDADRNGQVFRIIMGAPSHPPRCIICAFAKAIHLHDMGVSS